MTRIKVLAVIAVVCFATAADARPRRVHKPKPANPVSVVVAAGEDLITAASKFIGMGARQLGLPSTLWCADFLNKLTHSGTDRTAKSYLHRGTPATKGCTNCIAVLTRKGGGHVGIVKGYDGRGNPILISGNHGNRVAVSVYPASRVLGYRWVSTG
jgi:hypothetical protein